LIDLAATGLFDQRLILPRFVLFECKKGLDQESEIEKQKSRRVVEIIQRLEEIPGLNLRIDEHDFPEIKEVSHKLVQLARLLDAHILTADPNGLNSASYEGLKWINLFSLSNALKPVVQMGEMIQIKIQRYGKEPLQGVGYLEDGTMVVVNGGSEYLGDTIPVQVLSVKHTPTGRMIFCNSTREKRVFLKSAT
jgi:Integral membrane protein (PIN domain superfamily)